MVWKRTSYFSYSSSYAKNTIYVTFLVFLVPLIISCHDFLKIKIKNKYILRTLTLILIFSFHFSNSADIIKFIS